MMMQKLNLSRPAITLNLKQLKEKKFIKRIGSPERFLRFCNYGPQFGTMRVSSVELVYHNWYDSKKTTLARFELGGYTV